MYLFKPLHDLREVDFRIGLDCPPSDFLNSFKEPGKTLVGHPRVQSTREYENLSASGLFGPADEVPLVCARGGFLTFSKARWGFGDVDTPAFEPHRGLENRTYRPLGLIPASFVDLSIPGESDGAPAVLRVRAARGNLFLAAFCRLDPKGEALAVVPFVERATDPISKYMDWQPKLVTMSAVTDLKNFEFFRRTQVLPDMLESFSRDLEVEHIRR